MKSAPDPNIGVMLLDISRPDGVPARTAVVMGTIDNARERLLQCSRIGVDPLRIAAIALEECGKIFEAKALYDKAMGI